MITVLLTIAALNSPSPYARYNRSVINQENLIDIPDDEIHIGRGVMCKSLCVKDAYKATSYGSFFTRLHLGIHGAEDLSTRCVKVRKNTVGQRELSPKKREVVEDEFFRYLKEYKKLPDDYIALQMQKCNTYHHNAITGARSIVEHQKAMEAIHSTPDGDSPDDEN